MNKLTYLIYFLMITSIPLMAQEELGSETDGPPSLGSDVPVDGGISLLLAAGAAYVLRRVRNRNDKR